ncbi:hypothetical protein B9Z55_018810 [Caenorhabditis nigoni]|uniref:7TM GPCR serpentine receptor class x (Srx) domain-containing protein n=1 Tax=Caenorhabditis nigoni TaxID=1611254 RepID=A0A2G5TFN3_9PELO|nr:hypothetical protein B9Z55_018810 [Caenorhabditis nigoni]
METTTIVASVLGLISFLGVIFNWTVVIANRQITSSKHSFGILTAFQAFGDAIHSTIFFIFVCPTIYLFVTLMFNQDMQKFIMKSILRKLLRMTQLPKSTQIVKVVPELRTRRLRARQIITSEMTIIP